MDLADHVLAALKAAVEDFRKVRERVKEPRVAALVEEKMRSIDRRIRETEMELAEIEKSRKIPLD